MKFSVILIPFLVISFISFSQESNVTPGKVSFRGLGDLPGGEFSSSAQDISADGKVIIGFGTTSSGEEAFRWTEETGMVSLGNLPDKSFKKSWANKVSANGNVIVGYGDPIGNRWNSYKGFVWTSSEGMRAIGNLDTSKRSMAFCVSADGTVIAGDGGPAAFKWTKESQAKRMGVLPDRTHSRIVGMSAGGKVMIGQSYSLPAWDDEDGFIMKEDGTMQSMASLTGGNYCMVLAVSPDGSVVAGTTHTSSYPAFFWSKDKGFVTIGHLPERNTTHPGDMTPYGKIIVGGSYSGPDNGDAFIWDGIHGMRNLQTVLEKEYGLDLTGWKLRHATGITPDGKVIVGTGINPQENKEGFRVILNVETGRDLSVQSGLSLQENSPILKYSTLIGGSGWDYGHGIAVDDSGYVYVAGQANSSDYPATIKSFDKTHNGGSDILLTKLIRNGSALVYSTYIGGSGRDDTRKVFIDKKGSVYLTGSTESPDFPVTGNTLNGNSMGYLLKVSASGDSLMYSSRWVGGEKVMTDHDGNLVILGRTSSPDFPTTESAFSRKHAGEQDIFITKIDPIHNKIIFSTLIGGDGNDWAPSMTIDKDNNIIIAGRTNSENFPLKGAGYGTFAQGKFNIIVTKLKPDGSELVYSTLVGGTDDDWAFDITSDENNDVYITGVTKSDDFPVSKNAFDTSYNGGDDAILFKLNSNGTEIKYSTYLGGSLKDGGRGVVVDQKGRAFLTGCTRSIDFPVTDNAYDKTFNGAGSEAWAWGDPFLLVLNPEGTGIEYSTYIGGSNDEEAYGIAIDKIGDIYLCGVTSSSNYPTTPGAYSRTLNGRCNIYVTKFSFSTLDYYGQTLPQDTPIKFAALPSGSSLILHSIPSFSPSGDESFFATIPDFNTFTQSIYYRKKENGKWLDPVKASFSNGKYSDKLPCFSGDGKRVYFTSDRPLTGSGNPIDENVWYIEKNAAGWSDPICLDNSVNTSQHEGWITVAANNNLYFGRNDKLYMAAWQNDHYLPAQVLPIYTRASGVLGAIAPDESYYVVQSEYVQNSSGKWIDDLFIIMKTNGVWGMPIKLDSKINSMKSKCFAKISSDGKYLFFLGDNNEAYWVSTDFTKSLTRDR